MVEKVGVVCHEPDRSNKRFRRSTSECVSKPFDKFPTIFPTICFTDNFQQNPRLRIDQTVTNLQTFIDLDEVRKIDGSTLGTKMGLRFCDFATEKCGEHLWYLNLIPKSKKNGMKHVQNKRIKITSCKQNIQPATSSPALRWLHPSSNTSPGQFVSALAQLKQLKARPPKQL